VEEYTGQIVHERDPWLEMYTNGKTLAPGLQETLKDVLTVSMMARAATNLSFGAPCNITLEAELGYPQPGQLLTFQSRVATKGQEGFKFCNFMDQYLLCHLDTTTFKESCDCLPRMVWNRSKGACGNAYFMDLSIRYSNERF